MNRRTPDEERMERMNRGNSSGAPMLVGLMVGGLIGAGAMLLLAPQAGARTREELQDGVRDLRDRTTDTVKSAASQARARADELVSTARDKADELQSKGKEIAIDQLDKVSTAAQSSKRSLQGSRNTSRTSDYNTEA